MNIVEQFKKYYPEKYEETIKEINELNEPLKLKFMELLYINLQDLFLISIEHGIYYVAEFLYLYCNTFFEINDLNECKTVLSTQYIGNSVPVQTEMTKKITCNIEYMDNTNKKKMKIVTRLLQLKKYSKMWRDGKKFYYIYNKK
jgi:hypothetical protein